MSVESRIARLERANSRLSIWLLIALAFGASSVATHGCAVAEKRATADEPMQRAASDVLVARELRLVDAKGRCRVGISISENDDVELGLFDAEGRYRVGLHCTQEIAQVVASNSDGRTISKLGVYKDMPALACSSGGTVRLGTRVNENGAVSLDFFDGDGRKRTSLGSSKAGDSALYYLDGSGKSVSSLIAIGGEPGLLFGYGTAAPYMSLTGSPGETGRAVLTLGAPSNNKVIVHAQVLPGSGAGIEITDSQNLTVWKAP